MSEALSVYVNRQLMDQRQRIYDAPLPPLHAFELMPPRGEVALGATSFNRRVYRHFGRSQWVGGAANDLPLVGVGVIEDVYFVAMHGCAYQYTIKEQRNSQFAGVPLEDRRAMSGRRAILEFNNDAAFYGSVSKQITGLFSIPQIPRVSIDLALFQPGADPDATLAALYGLKNQIENQSEQAERPNVAGMAVDLYNYIDQTRASTLTDRTILQVFLAKMNEMGETFTVRKAREFNGAGPNGEDLIWMGSNRDDRLEHNVPDPLTILDPQNFDLVTKVPMISETAGTISEFPYAHVIAEVS